MRNDRGQLLLQDREIQILLEEMILLKASHRDELSEGILSEIEMDNLLNGDITPEVLLRIINHHKIKDNLVLIKRDISAMCYELNKSKNKITDNTKWEMAYEYSTQSVQIADVVSNLLGISSLNRNIKCPFHEDKSPSLKVYPKSNRFICFGCSARGSPLDFVMKYKNCSFREAVLYLSNL